MGGIVVRVHTEATVAGLEDLRLRLHAARAAGEMAAGLVFERFVRQQLTLTSHPPGTPTPSAPGTPPSLISGTLLRSVTTERKTGPKGPYVAVGPTVVYGRIHELGGRAGHGVYLPARPYVNPARVLAMDSARRVAVATVARELA